VFTVSPGSAKVLVQVGENKASFDYLLIFTNLSHHRLPSGLRTDYGFMTGPFLLSISVSIFSFFISLFV